MKIVCAAGLAMMLSTEVCLGGSAEDAILAAMKVSEVPNYSWTSVISDDVRTYELDGKTEKGGCTWVTLPMMPAIARRLGRNADAYLEAAFNRDATCVIRTADGWMLLQELPKCHEDWIDDPAMPASSTPFWALPFYTAASPAPMQAPLSDGFRERRGKGDIRVVHPHEELAVIVCSSRDWAYDGEVATGRLTDLGAQLLLVRDGDDRVEPLQAAGRFTLWTSNGFVTRYTVDLEGVLKIKRKKVFVRQNTKTLLKDFGRTRLNLPEEALLKLTW